MSCAARSAVEYDDNDDDNDRELQLSVIIKMTENPDSIMASDKANNNSKRGTLPKNDETYLVP